MAIHNAEDNSFKIIFNDHRLFADFIRDFINIDILKNVGPDDIEDLSERFLPLISNSRDSDTVKRINLKGYEPFFVIAVLEQQSQVDFRSSFKMFQYIYLVLDAWEKEAEKDDPGASQRKDFKYPPVLPIIFYNGKNTWTAEKNFIDRTYLNKAFEKYIPKFEYELVSLNDYSENDIIRFGDALSFVLLIDKVRDGRGESLLGQLPQDYMEKLKLHIPEYMVRLIKEVVITLLDKSGYDPRGAEQVAALIDRADRKGNGDMFEGYVEYLKSEREGAWERGREEGREEIARNALAKGMPKELIHSITGLDMEKIKKLSITSHQ